MPDPEELEDLLNRKAIVEEQLAGIEAHIYDLEGAYLEETANTGNVIKGFEGYLGGAGSSAGRPSTSAHRKPRFKESDRLFSRSSATYERSLGLDSEDIANNEAAQNAAYELARAEEAERERRLKKKRRIDPAPPPTVSIALDRRLSHKARHRDTDEYLEISP